MYLPTKNLWLVTLAGLIGDRVHQIVRVWNREDQWTIGQQWIRATDSVGANITEGCGRRHNKETLHFFYIARGSLDEAAEWARRARNRKLVFESDARKLLKGYFRLSKGLNALIRFRRKDRPPPATLPIV